MAFERGRGIHRGSGDGNPEHHTRAITAAACDQRRAEQTCAYEVLQNGDYFQSFNYCPSIKRSSFPRVGFNSRSAKEKNNQSMSKQAKAGWIIFAIAACTGWLIGITIPLFVASAIIGIIAITKDDVTHGVTLLVCSIVAAPLTAIVFGLLIMGIAFGGMQKRGTPAPVHVSRER